MAHREYFSGSHKEQHTAAITVDKGFLETITQEARFLPLYEEKIHKYKYTRDYSFYNNERLKCRWDDFRDARKPKIPFNFPCAKDVHFTKCIAVFDPKETVNDRANHRFHLRNGPGIDKFGQLPIPDDMHLRKAVYFDARDKKIIKNVVGKAGKMN